MAWQTPKTNWQANNALTPTDFNRIEGNIQELQNTKETPAGAQAKVDTHAGSKQTHGISSGYYIAKTSRSDQLPAWNDIQGKPSSFTPAVHTHSPAQINPQGAGSGLDADTVDGKHGAGLIDLSNYTEIVPAAKTVTATNTWEDWDLSAYGVPGNALVIINIHYPTTAGGNINVGARMNGSTVNRILNIIYSESSAWFVKTDANGVIEIYSNDTSARFRCTGYIK